MNKLPYGKDKILDIMKEIKEKSPELTIEVFICILHKRINPAFSYMGMSSVLYRFSVELWNQYVFDNFKSDFHLLIGYEDICF
jgi:hypothetical protein